ncbi:acetyl/propionyl/methylcrotonyl-CoA carboxylase subunit alpha [Rhodococcus sp. HNM0569]|uniref:acetyl-CoA carboxylase biotin carboxylase subunit n=1 Tax=Rhodococcus sp. HNM0569 TaxID=2716340 RepID=UPI00146A2945|nr:acetyl/propionyl/methylcrotonyl-CoA carboxylase subunit alpha [Rhodococcus sp. HNM0569]NLU81693.1 acetyl/propionyl/methylcrotonyl-CoA carboxylase subunit alpha [Rhodococcus sp. HNM0569]
MQKTHPATTHPVRFDTVLVANRGEIAVRVLRTLRRMGIRSVAVYSDADRDARHVHEADIAVRLGPAPARESYLSIERVLAAAVDTGAQAVHPGYGFLSENAEFAAACTQAGLVFLGPPPRAIEVMGDKITAKKAVTEYGVPVVPGIAEPGLDDDALVAAAVDVGYPILIKPSAGGGGKGMHRVDGPEALASSLRTARREAASAFGDDTLFLERFVERPRHIEVQVLADAHGGVVHLGERECSLQRRHQKVVEEAPSPLLDAQTRARIGAAACDTARSVGYTGAGTVEFIVSADRPDEFFFMEMNTRLQVEHPVTEEITGLDLVEWQVRVAAGEALDFTQDDVHLDGHAIEARVYAEDPARGFLPTGGTVLVAHEPTASGPGTVRVDSGIDAGTVVASDYDPMLAKVIVHAPTRAEALVGLDRALGRTRVLGLVTNVDFLRYLLAQPDVRTGALDTALIDRVAPDYTAPAATRDVFVAAALAPWLESWSSAEAAGDPWALPTGWRAGAPAPVISRYTSGGGESVTVEITGSPDSATVSVTRGDGARETVAVRASRRGDALALTVAGTRAEYTVVREASTVWVADDDGTWPVRVAEHERIRADDSAADAEIVSPMPGTVIAAPAASGDHVRAGDTLVVVEAMKMEHALTAPADGVAEILVATGDLVQVEQPLARVHTHPDAEASHGLGPAATENVKESA